MDLLAPLQALDPTLVIVLVGLLVFGESAALLGLIVPGEVGLFAAGALAATGHLPLAPLLVAALVGAFAGQWVGYELGRRWGAPLLARAARYPSLARHLPRAEQLVQERGTSVVLLSRWAGPLRALVPLLVGSSQMRRDRFLVANLAGGALWIGGVGGAGWLAARGATSAAAWLGWTSTIAVTVVLGGLVLAWVHGGGDGVLTARLRRLAWPMAGTALGIGALALLIANVGTEAIASAVQQLDGWALLTAVGLKLVALACLTQVHRASYRLSGAGHLAYGQALPIALGAFSLTQVLPGGGVAGGLYAARRLRRHGADAVAATTGVLVFGTVNMGTLALGVGLATSVAALVAPRYGAYAVPSLAATVVLAAGLGLAYGLATRPAWRARVASRIDGLRWRGRTFGRSCAQALHRPVTVTGGVRGLARPAVWSALAWTADVAVLVALVRAAGGDLPVLGVLVAFAAAHLLAGVPATPGGLGVVEAGMAGTLLAFGADAGVASVVVLGYRATASLLPVLLSAPVVVRGLRRERDGEVSRDRQLGPAEEVRS